MLQKTLIQEGYLEVEDVYEKTNITAVDYIRNKELIIFSVKNSIKIVNLRTFQYQTEIEIKENIQSSSFFVYLNSDKVVFNVKSKFYILDLNDCCVQEEIKLKENDSYNNYMTGIEKFGENKIIVTYRNDPVIIIDLATKQSLLLKHLNKKNN